MQVSTIVSETFAPSLGSVSGHVRFRNSPSPTYLKSSQFSPPFPYFYDTARFGDDDTFISWQHEDIFCMVPLYESSQSLNASYDIDTIGFLTYVVALFCVLLSQYVSVGEHTEGW